MRCDLQAHPLLKSYWQVTDAGGRAFFFEVVATGMFPKLQWMMASHLCTYGQHLFDLVIYQRIKRKKGG